ncbi:MAG: efflux transporter periplasmic adaptor subunit, partial [Bacteroidetes bacterium]|nr:efflux transporter periplasmic adaptor subunit [Bacteroidota bacterium]
MKKQPIISVLIIGILSSCGNHEDVKKPEVNHKITLSEEQIRLGKIEFNTAEKRNISEVISAIGAVEVPPQNLVSVSIPMGGYLKYTDLLPGSKVAKGQVLARVQNIQFVELQQEYLSSKAKLEYADAEYKRQLELYREKAGSEKSMQQAKSEAALYNISLHALEEKLKILGLNPSSVNPSSIRSELNILSPVNGFVASLKVNT